MTLADKLKPGFRLLGPSTCPTTLSTGEVVAFTKEALDNAADSPKKRFIPSPVEHLHYLPPIGRLAEVEVIEHDGHYWLAGRDVPLSPGETEDMVLPAAADESGPSEHLALSVSLSTEPRNFEPEDFAELRKDATHEVGEISLHSALPPLIWSFVVVLSGLGALGAKAFVQEFYKQLGAASAQGFLSWLNSASGKAKEGEREQLAEFRFPCGNGVTVLAYCPFTPDAQHSLSELSAALSRIADVATFVGQVEGGGVPAETREVAFIWDDNGWHLAWWATDAASYVTPWLNSNAPDPGRFLGGLPPTLRLLEPYLPNLPGASSPEAVEGNSLAQPEDPKDHK